jgi:ATP-dependent DNA helicase RecG
MLLSRTELGLGTVLLLDKVQKRERITPEGLKCLRRKNLVEGRFPNIHVSADVASVTADRARYIRFKGFDEAYYQKLVLEFIRKYGSASREDIDALLMDKLPEILTEVQKRNKINRLLSVVMCGKRELIRNVGSRRAPTWVLLERRGKNNKNNKSTKKSD